MNKVNLSNKVEEWAKKFQDTLTVRKLTKEEVELFWACSLREKELNEDAKLRKLLEYRQGGLASALYLRAKAYHTYELSLALACYLSESKIVDNFAKSTMIVNYFQYMAHTRGYKRVGMKEFSYIFSHGIPTKEFLGKYMAEKQGI